MADGVEPEIEPGINPLGLPDGDEEGLFRVEEREGRVRTRRVTRRRLTVSTRLDEDSGRRWSEDEIVKLHWLSDALIGLVLTGLFDAKAAPGGGSGRRPPPPSRDELLVVLHHIFLFPTYNRGWGAIYDLSARGEPAT